VFDIGLHRGASLRYINVLAGVVRKGGCALECIGGGGGSFRLRLLYAVHQLPELYHRFLRDLCSLCARRMFYVS